MTRAASLTQLNADLDRLARPPARGTTGADVRLAAYRPIKILAAELP